MSFFENFHEDQEVGRRERSGNRLATVGLAFCCLAAAGVVGYLEKTVDDNAVVHTVATDIQRLGHTVAVDVHSFAQWLADQTPAH